MQKSVVSLDFRYNNMELKCLSMLNHTVFVSLSGHACTFSASADSSVLYHVIKQLLFMTGDSVRHLPYHFTQPTQQKEKFFLRFNKYIS